MTTPWFPSSEVTPPEMIWENLQDANQLMLTQKTWHTTLASEQGDIEIAVPGCQLKWGGLLKNSLT